MENEERMGRKEGEMEKWKWKRENKKYLDILHVHMH